MGWGIFRRNQPVAQPVVPANVQQKGEGSARRLRGVFKSQVKQEQSAVGNSVRQTVAVVRNGQAPQSAQAEQDNQELDLSWVKTLVFNTIVATSLNYFAPQVRFLAPVIAEAGKECGSKGLEKALDLGNRVWNRASNLLDGAGVTAEKVGGIALDIGRYTIPSLPFMFYGGGLFMGASILATATYKLVKSGENKDLNALVERIGRKREIEPNQVGDSSQDRKMSRPSAPAQGVSSILSSSSRQDSQLLNPRPVGKVQDSSSS